MNDDDEPCWGVIEVLDEIPDGEDDWVWLHTCSGHSDIYGGGRYKPEPNTEVNQ